jgi:hypothetical protein
MREVCTSLLSSIDLTHLQQVSSSPRSLAVVVIALKEVLSNAPQSPYDSRTFPVFIKPERGLFL